MAEPLIRVLLAERQEGLSTLWDKAGWQQTTVGALIASATPVAGPTSGR